MSNANKHYYKKAYSQIHVSCELQERLMNMKEEKKMREEISGRLMKRRGQRLAWRVAVTAAASAVALPTGVFAASKISDYLFEGKATKNNYEVDVSVKQPEVQPTGTNDSEKLAVVKNTGPVALKGTNLAGYTLSHASRDDGWYDFAAKGGFSSGKEFSVEIIKVDTDADKGIFIKDVASAKDITLNGHKAISIHRNSIVGSMYNTNTEYTRRVVVFYEDLGYILHYYAQEGLAEDTLLKYAEQITLEKCAKKDACSYLPLSQYMNYNRDYDNTLIKTKVADSQIYHIGETVTYEGIEYEVQKVEVTDSVQDILKQNGKGIRSDIKYWKALTDKNGKLKSYTRETVETGNGKDEPWAKVTATEEIALKFVRLTVRVKNIKKNTPNTPNAKINPENTGTADVQISNTLINLQREDGTLYEYNPEFGMPEAVDVCKMDHFAEYFKETNGGQHFYFHELEPGEEGIFHLGYFVDEDMLDSMAIRMDYWNTTDDGEAYIDISQK